jgi:Protein of unknown function (DUF3099)
VRLRRNTGAVLITSAATSRPEEIRSRERRYVISMLARAVLFILAVVAFSGWVRFVAVAAALVMPWVAVVVANGGPPRRRETPSLGAGRSPTPDREVPRITAPRHDVIDPDDQRDG